MTRNAETELLDDITDLFNPYDNVPSGLPQSIAADVVDLVKHRLMDPDDMDAVFNALDAAQNACESVLESLNDVRRIVPDRIGLR